MTIGYLFLCLMGAWVLFEAVRGVVQGARRALAARHAYRQATRRQR